MAAPLIGPMVVLGIDPGSQATGWALVTRSRGRYHLLDAGAIRTKSKDPIPHRLKVIYDGLCGILVVHEPTQVAIEAIFRHKSIESALRLGQARGVALLAAADLPVFEYNAMTVKKSVTGSGRADKDQLRRVVGMLTGADTAKLAHDACDAAAIAITHLAHARNPARRTR